MLQDTITGLKNLFSTGAHTEVREQYSRRRVVALLDGNLVGNARTDGSGVCARVFRNGIYGFSSAAECDEKTAKEVLEAASRNASFLGKHAGKDAKAIPAIPYEKKFYPVSYTDAEQKKLIGFAQEIDEYLTKKYTGLVSRYVAVSEDSMEKLLCTSDGVDSHFFAPRCFLMINLTALTDQNVPVSLFDAFGGAGTFTDNFENPDYDALYAGIDRVYEALMKKREGVYADAGYKTVILGSPIAGMIAHEAVGHTVEADLVLGGSVAGPNLNRQVASEMVNLTDFAYEAFGEKAPLPVYVDDEGTPAKDCKLIENGILTGYMNSRETAQRFGMEACGNARAFAFSDEPLIRMRNTSVHPGKDKLEDMIASIDDGYYLIGTNNGQADTTGEFMFGITEGYEIKKGKLGKAILDTTVSGVAFDMLKTVDMISDKVCWVSCGMCGKKQPMPVGMGGPDMRCKIMIGGR